MTETLEAVAIVSLHRLRQRNAISEELLAALDDTFRLPEATRAIVLHGP
jgi:enoyl-CoA hydratase/carnithine racemase